MVRSNSICTGSICTKSIRTKSIRMANGTGWTQDMQKIEGGGRELST